MSKITVLGAGMVGSAMAIDMAKNHEVTLTDRSEKVLERVLQKEPKLRIDKLDVCDTKALEKAISPADLVICAVPGFLGFATLKKIIEAGKNVVDISFFPEDALALQELAVEKGVTAIVDCGVAPGLDNIILGHFNETIQIDTFECLVGGLPKVKKWPFCYKAPFSPVDVIEEYTRPARYVENGQQIVREALTDCDYVEIEGVGTLESFNSDGLRSLIQTMAHIPNMKEKTLRYPGHVEYVRVLKESGFFGEIPICVNGQEITPLDFSSKILFKEWKLGEEEPELTVMTVRIEGIEKASGNRVNLLYTLHDEYDAATKTSSMARTTGYTATAVANWVLDGHFDQKGLYPPELIGGVNGCFDYVIAYLKERNVNLRS